MSSAGTNGRTGSLASAGSAVPAPTGRRGDAAAAPADTGAALEAVFRREYPRIVSIARRVLRSSADAEDVAQDVFMQLHQANVPDDRVSGWLAVAAAHTALNRLRAEHRRRQREAAADPRGAETRWAPDTADVAIVEDEVNRLRAVLGRLQRTQALVLVLRHSGLSYQEIAAETGLAVGGIGTTLRRAEAALRKEMSVG